MKVIVIDVDNTIDPHKKALFNFTKKVKCKDHNGIAVVVKNDKLNTIPKGQKRLEYFNSTEFLAEIVSVCYFDVHHDLTVCIIEKIDTKYAPMILDEIQKELPVYEIVVPTETPKEAKQYINIGFESPHRCRDGDICVVKSKSENVKNKNLANAELEYLLSQRKPICNLSFFIKPEAARYLKYLLNKDFEVAGLIKSVRADINDKIVYELDVDKKSVSKGEKEEVSGVQALFNFHTHPRKAYKRNKVKYAWPSAQDYLAYLYMAIEEKTVFHCVVAIEGLYVLSLTSNKVRGDDINKRIKKLYKVNDDRHPHEYIKYIHGLKGNIFNLQYFPWKDIEKGQVVHVSFFKDINDNCFINDKAFSIAKRIN